MSLPLEVANGAPCRLWRRISRKRCRRARNNLALPHYTPLATREGMGVSPLTALIAALSAAAGVSACYTVNL